jgi:3,4-dihydroxy 2-butanone 4-phosphate synthase/GTP cyclohydrolase II
MPRPVGSGGGEGDGSVSMARIEEAIAAIGRGEVVVVVDDADRENEGDLVMAAEFATPEKVAFFLTHTSGLLCVSLTDERADELELPLMVSQNTESQRTAFTVTVDYRFGTTTGISAGDRSATIRALIGPDTKPADLARPGHVLPLRYRPGGVLKRAGHTEAGLDLARMAGCNPAGLLCEIVTEDKQRMARQPELERFAAAHGLPIISIADLVRYRRHREKLVERVAAARIPTQFGEFIAYGFRSIIDGQEHIALVAGDLATKESVLVRVHSECLTGDTFGSLRCDCGPQLDAAMSRIGEEGVGVVVYLRGHEGRGIGLTHKLRAYNLQDNGMDTVDANVELGLPVDSREYGIGAQILVELGVTRMRLMTNNPAKYHGLEGYGLDIIERLPLQLASNPENVEYLRTKRERMGHLLTGLDDFETQLITDELDTEPDAGLDGHDHGAGSQPGPGGVDDLD